MKGGTPLLWQHLFWFLGHPEVYIIMLPAWALPRTFLRPSARRPIFGYRSMVYAIMAIGVLSFIVWGHHMFVSGMSPFLGSVFVMTTLCIAIPSAVKTFNWLATLWKAKIRFTTPMLFALGIVSLFVTGGLTGIFLGTNAVDIQLHDTYFVVAHFHFIMAGAGLFGALRGGVLLVSEDVRPLHERGNGEGPFLAHLPRVLRHVLPDALPRYPGMMRRIYDPNTYDYLEAAPAREYFHLDCGLRPRRGAAHLRRQLRV